MKIIGLTGSIGMGKSATGRLLRVLKIPVFDSDACVHELMSRNGMAVPEITRLFPEVFDKKNACINRQKLGAIVFGNSAKIKALEDILHPLVWAAQRNFIAKHRRAGFKQVALDIPLLFETNRDKICDMTLCVTAPRFIQHQRVMSRPHMTHQKFLSILQGQLADTHKKRLADFVVPTGLGRAIALQSLKKALRYPSSEK